MRYAIVCDSRKGKGILARLPVPFRGNFWTENPKTVCSFDEKTAQATLRTLRYNNPRLVPYAEAVETLQAQQTIIKAHE